jgi:catalase
VPATSLDGPELALPEPAPGELVDALHTVFGDHHARAVHAKGILATGTFEPSPAAAQLSHATLFASHTVPVLLRFSNFTGIPDIPDTDGHANPRGLALKFQLPDGSTTDVVSHSFNGFPVATATEFRELLLALAASGSAAPPTPLDRFLESHPIAKTFLTSQKPAPRSYATLEYFGVNAFRFTNEKGEQTHVRYRFVPVQGEAFLTRAELANLGPDYLSGELRERLASGAAVYRWQAQIAEAGDAVDDPSVAWPEARPLLELGTIRITAIAPDAANLDRDTVFLPVNVPQGIEPADPMLTIRQHAYPISFGHRRAQPTMESEADGAQ